MERQGKAKLYRLVDQQRGWEELGIGYASAQAAGDGTYEIFLDPLDPDEAEAWRQPLEERTEYVAEDMMIQWQFESWMGSEDAESDDDDGGYSYALSFENEEGCRGVIEQINKIQNDMRSEDDVFAMPPATVGNLIKIEDVLKSCQSHIKKHTVSNYLSSSSYIASLLDLLQPLEDVEDFDSIKVLFNIVKMIVALNVAELMHILLHDSNYKKFFGLMEYNPDEQQNPRHREFIEKEVKYVSVIPVDEPLLQLIHFTFRLGYLRDIHPGVLDDPMVSRIAHMIGLNHVEIVREISNKPDAMELILEAIRRPEQASCSRVQALTLLYEYCDTAAKPFFALKERLQIFSNMCTTRFFNTLRDVLRATHSAASLTSKNTDDASAAASDNNLDRESRVLVARILRRVLDQKQMECRKYILESDPLPDDAPKQGDVAEQETFLREERHAQHHPLFLCIIRLLTDSSEMGVQADALEILKSLLSEQSMNVGTKDRFLELFYHNYMQWLVQPLGTLDTVSAEELAQESDAAKNSKNLLTELLSFCVEQHGFRIKYFSIKHNTIAQVMQLCRYPNKFLRLGAIRFVRTCIGVKDQFFPRFIAKNDLLQPMFAILDENGTRNTMTLSTISELLNHVWAVPVKPLLLYIVSKYGRSLDNMPSKELAIKLRTKHEQLEGGRSSGVSNGSSASGASDKTDDAMDKRVSEQQKKHRESMSEESYFDDEEDDDDSDSGGSYFSHTGFDASGGGGGDSPPPSHAAASSDDEEERGLTIGPSPVPQKKWKVVPKLLVTGPFKRTGGSGGGSAGAGSDSDSSGRGGGNISDDDADRSDDSASVKKPRLEKSSP